VVTGSTYGNRAHEKPAVYPPARFQKVLEGNKPCQTARYRYHSRLQHRAALQECSSELGKQSCTQAHIKSAAQKPVERRPRRAHKDLFKKPSTIPRAKPTNPCKTSPHPRCPPWPTAHPTLPQNLKKKTLVGPKKRSSALPRRAAKPLWLRAAVDSRKTQRPNTKGNGSTDLAQLPAGPRYFSTGKLAC